MKSQTIRVLMVDDSEDDFLIIRRMLSAVQRLRYQVDWVSGYEKALDRVRDPDQDVMLVDYRLGADSGLDLLRQTAPSRRVPVILLTGQGDYEVDREAMELGASDFLNKNKLDSDRLERAIRYALEREESRKKLQERTVLLSSVLECMGEGVVVVDQKGALQFSNQEAEKMLGLGSPGSYPDWVKDYGLYLMDRQTPFPTEDFPLTKALRGEDSNNVEMFMVNSRSPQGSFFSVTARPLRDEAGKAMGAEAVFRDITALRKAEEQLERLSLYNHLTGLPNRALFLDRVGQAVHRSRKDGGSPFAVLFLELEGLKKINDTFGHALGDQILRESGKRLEKLVSAHDTAAHLGGKEFAVLFNGDPAEASLFGERLRQAFLEPLQAEGQEVFLNPAVGLVSDASAYEKAPDVVRDAQTALAWARNQAKPGPEVFKPSMRSVGADSLQLESDLRRALERREFLLHYQPIVSLESGQLTGFEALLRWKHPQKGMVPPGDFVHLAEETGLILPIGDWVLWEVCRQIRLWLDRFTVHPDFAVSVNLSPKQFARKDLTVQVLRSLAERRLTPRQVNLEITESAMMENFDAAYLILHELRKSHIRLHLDDFGTGYSSLSRLHRFPLDLLKIDQSFVNGMMSEQRQSGIVKAILALAAELGMGVIAEGVETAEQSQKLKALHCKEAQGYFFSRPLDPEAAAKLLETGKRWA